MLTLIVFIAILAALVLSHELGHFLVARQNGIKVDEFGFGFPPRLFGIQLFKGKKLEKIAESEEMSVKTETMADGGVKEIITDNTREIDLAVPFKKWRFVFGNRAVEELKEENEGREGTVYSINLIPLGGFVKIKGEGGENPEDADSFAHKKIWQRAVVLVAGVTMNVILAAALLSVGFMVGLPQIVDGLPEDAVVRDRRLEIARVLPGKPAEKAGLLSGDVIVKVGALANPRLKEMQDYVDARKNENIKVTVRRGQEIINKEIQPAVYEETGRAGIGVSIAEVGFVRYPFFRAIWEGIVAAILYLKEIILAFFFFFKGLFGGESVGGEVTGPVGIAVMTGQVARLGFVYLLQFTAVLSLNLAIINILPIPALDGGRLLFLLIAKIRGREISQRVEQMFHTAGFAALMLLIVFITARDLNNFAGSFFSRFLNLF